MFLDFNEHLQENALFTISYHKVSTSTFILIDLASALFGLEIVVK
jgi:hypothetical protein